MSCINIEILRNRSYTLYLIGPKNAGVFQAQIVVGPILPNLYKKTILIHAILKFPVPNINWEVEDLDTYAEDVCI